MATTAMMDKYLAIQETRQIIALEKLARMVGTGRNGGQMLRDLRRLERNTNRAAVRLCNGEINQNQWEAKAGYARRRVAQIIGGEVPGFFVNGDPRGYSLKISDDVERKVLWTAGIELHRDMGGYAILAPEI